MKVGSAPDPERLGHSAVGSSLGDWIFASRNPLASIRPALPGEAGRRIAPSGPPAARDIEAELARLVRASAPTRRVLCALAARAIEIRSGSRLGFARTSDQARERHGISARSLQEFARVHRVLTQAPALDAALQAGSLGWTAVRSLARLERIEDEALWIRRVKVLPLPELEHAVRAASRAAEVSEAVPPPEPDDEEPDAWVLVACTRRARAKWPLGRELARRVAGGRLPRWECAEVVAAEASSAAPSGPGTRCDLDEAIDSGASLGDVVRRRPAGDPQAAGAAPTEPGAASRSATRAGGDDEGRGARIGKTSCVLRHVR